MFVNNYRKKRNWEAGKQGYGIGESKRTNKHTHKHKHTHTHIHRYKRTQRRKHTHTHTHTHTHKQLSTLFPIPGTFFTKIHVISNWISFGFKGVMYHHTYIYKGVYFDPETY